MMSRSSFAGFIIFILVVICFLFSLDHIIKEENKIVEVQTFEEVLEIPMIIIPEETRIYEQYQWIEVEATAYANSEEDCFPYYDGKTASGRDANLPGVAVDPKLIPLGSHIDIPGITLGDNNNGSWLLADDVGGAIKGNRIDIRFPTREEALIFGRKIIKIRVWRK